MTKQTKVSRSKDSASRTAGSNTATGSRRDGVDYLSAPLFQLDRWGCAGNLLKMTDDCLSSHIQMFEVIAQRTPPPMQAKLLKTGGELRALRAELEAIFERLKAAPPVTKVKKRISVDVVKPAK